MASEPNNLEEVVVHTTVENLESELSANNNVEVVSSESLDVEDHNNDVNDDNDVVYDGGLCETQDDYQVYYEEEEEDNESIEMDPENHADEDVEIELSGKRYKVPYTSECHLCNDNMYLCIRKTRYRGEMKEYPAYRCIRKGCQTFRSVRKVFSNYFDNLDYFDASSPPQSPTDLSGMNPRINRPLRIRTEKVAIPTRVRDANAMTLTNRMKVANQKRSQLFSEFSNKMCRELTANRSLRPRRHEEPVGHGTLLYINKELNAQQIVDIQEAVIHVLINLKKMPIPLTVHDMPSFASCPWSKNELEQGLRSDEGFEEFSSIMAAAPQPPLPKGFTERDDKTIIYRDPDPHFVPNCLIANSPEKQAENEAMYERRKSEQEARKFDKRFNEKRMRAWKSVKKEFDMVEDTNVNYQPMNTQGIEGSQFTVQQLLERTNGQKRGSIRKSKNESTKKMKWINSEEDETDSSNALPNDYLQNTMDPSNILIEATRDDDKKPLSDGSLHGNLQQQRGLPVLAPIPVPPTPPLGYSQYMYGYQCASPTGQAYFVPTRPGDLMYSSFGTTQSNQYMVPQNEVEVVDQTHSSLSSFLTSYVPSPITRNAPMDFGDDVSKTTHVQNNIDPAEIMNAGEQKIIETSLKFDPPNI
ncbi:unnamed protein product [Caenorhabditis angaria]|uniref:Uncharacterized protein n=1 Tax=Caenorhabditis angaria TaxID=860376 RepID=A0A9P1MZD1_9PELO|nr:unnamed protein product [Caenorhabditis angaria]